VGHEKKNKEDSYKTCIFNSCVEGRLADRFQPNLTSSDFGDVADEINGAKFLVDR
jgi:hypothetical protein